MSPRNYYSSDVGNQKMKKNSWQVSGSAEGKPNSLNNGAASQQTKRRPAITDKTARELLRREESMPLCTMRGGRTWNCTYARNEKIVQGKYTTATTVGWIIKPPEAIFVCLFV